MMLSSRNFGRLTRVKRSGSRSFEPAWLAPLDAVVALVPVQMNDPKHDPNRRLVRFSQPQRREEGRIA